MIRVTPPDEQDAMMAPAGGLEMLYGEDVFWKSLKKVNEG